MAPGTKVALWVEAKLRDAVRRGVLDRAPGDALARAGLAEGVIDAGELEALAAADEARDAVIQVDAFDAVSFPLRRGYAPPP